MVVFLMMSWSRKFLWNGVNFMGIKFIFLIAIPLCLSADGNFYLYDAMKRYSQFVEGKNVQHLGVEGDSLAPFDAIVAADFIEYEDDDIEAMEKVKSRLKEGGLLFLSIPIGNDRVVGNLYRVYGKLRLKALLRGWRIVEYFGFTSEDLENEAVIDHRPVFVLKPLFEVVR